MRISRPFKKTYKLKSTLVFWACMMPIFLFVSMSCSSINLFSLVETPTFTPTTIPTDTPTPTLTATLTRTPTPSASPTPLYTSTPDGWTKYTQDEMEFWLPDGWEERNINVESIYEDFAEVSSQVPELAPLFETALSDPTMLEPLRVIAVKVHGNGENMSITTRELPMPMTIGQIADLLELSFQETEGIEYSIGTPLEIDGMSMIPIQSEVFYQTADYGNFGVTMLQFIAIRNQRLYTITFTTDADDMEDLKPVFQQIASSFRVEELE